MTKDFFRIIVVAVTIQAKEKNLAIATLFLNSKGFTLRGLIGGKLGSPLIYRQSGKRSCICHDRVNHFLQFLRGYYKILNKPTFDYFDARGLSILPG